MHKESAIFRKCIICRVIVNQISRLESSVRGK